MKATIHIPDDIYRQVKAKSALAGRAVRDVTIELYRRWLSEPSHQAASQSAEQWLDEWVRLGQATLRESPGAPTATDILARDRDRLERP